MSSNAWFTSEGDFLEQLYAAWPGEIAPEVLAAADKLMKGTLSEEDVRSFALLPDTDWYDSAIYAKIAWLKQGFLTEPRDQFVYRCGYSLTTREWMGSLARLLHCFGANSVLEIAAGHGYLVRPMRARGFNWRATDTEPMNDLVEAGDGAELARAFAKRHPDGVLFAAWPPDDLDKELIKTGLPLILTGDRRWVGSDGVEFLDASVEFPGFRDVPNWMDVNDLTRLTPTNRLETAKLAWTQL